MREWPRRTRLERVPVARAIAVSILLVVASPGIVIAAEPAPAAPGARVRLTTAKSRLVGRFVELNGDSIVLEQSKWGGVSEKLTVDRREVVGLELSERGSRKSKGAKIGVLAGLGAAIAIGAFGGESCSSEPVPADWVHFGEKLDQSACLNHAEAALLGGIVTVPLGALVGAAVMPGERWRPVPVAGVSVRPVASRGGLGVQLAIGF